MRFGDIVCMTKEIEGGLNCGDVGVITEFRRVGIDKNIKTRNIKNEEFGELYIVGATLYTGKFTDFTTTLFEKGALNTYFEPFKGKKVANYISKLRKKYKRTDVDFSKHELKIVKNKHMKKYSLLKPGTLQGGIIFIICDKATIVLGVYGHYKSCIFYQEFCPSEKGYVNDSHWKSMLETPRFGTNMHPYDIRQLNYTFDAFDEICERIYKGA